MFWNGIFSNSTPEKELVKPTTIVGSEGHKTHTNGYPPFYEVSLQMKLDKISIHLVSFIFGGIFFYEILLRALRWRRVSCHS